MMPSKLTIAVIFVNRGSELDFEDPSKNIYNLTIQVEGGIKTTLVQTIEVNDVNEPPVFRNDTTAIAKNENTDANEIVVPLNCIDPDTNDKVVFEIIDGDPNDRFRIDDITESLMTNKKLDFEADSSYQLVIQATDDDKESDFARITVNINDLNERPIFAEGSSTTRSIPENSGVDELVGIEVTAEDVDKGNGYNRVFYFQWQHK